jgi:NitT/TauT family transport system substrate-binding protein
MHKSTPPSRVSRRTVVSLLGLTTIAGAIGRARPALADLETIRITGLITEAMCPLYYAIRTGRFARAGLDVQYTPNNSGAAAMAAVVSGALEMGSSNTLSICSAHMRDIPVTIAAPQVLYTTRTREAMLQVAVNSAIHTGADLNGKTIAVPTLAGINALAAKAWVDKNGGDASTLKFVEMPNASQPEAIAQHRIDAAILEPPVLEASIADGTSRTIGDPMGAIASQYMIAAFVVKSDWANQHADALKRFCHVLRDAAAYVNTHWADTAPMVAELTKIDLGIVSRMARTTSGTSLDPTLLQPLIDAAAKYAFIPRAFPAHDLFWSGA